MVDEAILKTLCYRDLFDYPLTEEEIMRFLVGKDAPPREVARVCAQLVAEGKVEEKEGFYFLAGRGGIVKTRLRREKISERKFAWARRFARILRHLPWIRAVFLTGAIAAGNAQEKDDIDLLIVTRKNRVWLARFLSTLLFDLLRARRRPGKEGSRDQFCLNMFLSETALMVPDNEQNLYTAHEIALAKPLWAKDYLHQRLLGENPWILSYLPNLDRPEVKIKAGRSPHLLARMVDFFWTFADLLARKLQLIYMRKKRTREIVERQRILFHPIDLAREILPAFKVRVYRVLHVVPAA